MNEHAVSPMIVRSAAAGGFVRANPAFLAQVGFTAEELAERPLIEWIVREDREALQEAMERCADACTLRHLTKEGDPFPLELRLRRQGEETFVLGRRANRGVETAFEGSQVEANVKSTLHRIAEIVEAANPGYKCSILLVAEGRFVKGAGPSLPEDYNNAIDGFAVGPTVGSCGTAIYWNAPVVVEDIQNDPLWIPFAELAKKAGVAACWSHPFATQSGRVLGALALYSPEPRTPTAAQLRALRAAAQMTGLAVERGRAEEELRIANEIKDRFMANMSHEIRTPLNALIGITDSLPEFETGLPAEEIHLLRESGEQLLELFAGVIELTEGQDRQEPGDVIDLRATCLSVCKPLEVQARAKGLDFECRFSTKVPRWVCLDSWSFERALRLLTHNAVKFTDRGKVAVLLDVEGNELHVCISDTGCGIDLDRLSELREPFVQGDLSTTKRYAGFGLGLALSDLCMRALGGEMEFHANEPAGTMVTFRLPVQLAPAPEEIENETVGAKGSSKGLPVLVVEDNRLNSRVIESMLLRSGYGCEVTVNGEEALQAVRENDYACVLMDCQMPVMDGYQATREIRSLEAGTGSRVPIIAVTANALAGDRERCLEVGMDDYLKKPVRREELLVALEEYAGKPNAAS